MLTSGSLEDDLNRLGNVFSKIVSNDSRFREQASKLREEISQKWCEAAKKNLWFEWPSTSIQSGLRDNKVNSVAWRPNGMLGLLGYHVGDTQPLGSNVRQEILRFVYESHLPPVVDKKYFDEWGAPRSSQRLQKTANTLAAFTRNAKRNDPDKLARAIRDWEKDLKYLYERFYVGELRFGWPLTEN